MIDLACFHAYYAPSEMESTLKGKYLLSKGASSFFIE